MHNTHIYYTALDIDTTDYHRFGCGYIFEDIETVLRFHQNNQPLTKTLKHLNECPLCQQHLQLEKRIRNLIRHACTTEKVSDSLREKVRLKISRTIITDCLE